MASCEAAGARCEAAHPPSWRRAARPGQGEGELTLTLARTLALTLTLTLTLSLSLQANPTPTPSTSKVSSELGGIVFICLSPYARPGGMVSRALPPTFIICSPSCHPGITELSLNSVGSPRENDESKTVPSLSVPV